MRFCSLRFSSPMLPTALAAVAIALPLTAITACQSSEPEESEHNVELTPFEPAEENPSETEQVNTAEAAAPVAQDEVASESFDDDVAQLQRRQEQRASLAEHMVGEGETLLGQGDLHGALAAFAEALQFAPQNEAARAGMRDVKALLGDGYSSAADFFELDASREVVRRAQMRMKVDQAVLDGDRARSEGDFSTALVNYREAEVILQYHPLTANDSIDEAIVGQKIRATLDMQNEQASAREMESKAAAVAEAAREEEDAKRYRENALHRLYSDANAAFQRENYEQAGRLAKNLLILDPGNEYAIDLRDLASEARHLKVDTDNRRNLHEQWLRTFAEIEAMSVPQTEPVVFDDLEYWNEVQQRDPIAFSKASASGANDIAPILRKLESTQIPVKFGSDGEGAPLVSVAEYLQRVTGINFVVSSLLKDEDEDETSVNLNLPDRSVKKLLDLIAATSEFVRWKIQNGVVNFVLPEELTGGQELRFYDVRDLIHPVANFPGREINVRPSQGTDIEEEDLEAQEALVVTGDDLDALIRDFINPESWEEDDNNGLQVTESGTLIVNHTPAIHEQIESLLEDLREATAIMVDIEARFVKMEDNFLEDIGVDFRGLGAPGTGTNEFFNDFGDTATQTELGNSIGQGNDLGAFFDNGANGQAGARLENLYDTDLGDQGVLTGSGGLSFQWTYLQDLELELILRAVAKSERIELVTAPHILVHNTARSNLTVLNQVAYIQDYDVEIAQAASIADPVVAVIEDGVILDVRPVVSADRRFITVEMRPTVAELVRPIPEFTTSLGGGTAVTLQLPQLEVSRVRTSVPIPDGATVLLGGLRIRDEENLQSGIPILNKIPIVSLLFERKGQFITSRKLLILLKAEIVIPMEKEPTLNNMNLQLGQG